MSRNLLGANTYDDLQGRVLIRGIPVAGLTSGDGSAVIPSGAAAVIEYTVQQQWNVRLAWPPGTSRFRVVASGARRWS